MVSLASFTFPVCLLASFVSLGQWVEKNNGVYGGGVHRLAANSSTLFAGTTYGGVLRSTDNGTNWTPANDNITFSGLSGIKQVRSIVVDGGDVFVSTDSGIFSSSDNGINWMPANSGLTTTNIGTLAVSNKNLFAVGSENSIF